MQRIEESEISQEIQQRLREYVRKRRDKEHLDFHALAWRLGISEKEAQEIYIGEAARN
ncbi:MAG: hypothetical protein N3E45_09290 [Oscillatoriaceae bacterium SKW80]|nr:hypothetical protein [Oscillatoriaceae bacterium SKYG93]MCX8121008.1 hypothetical protein [Oscillatoriaceae bacterium SKW80]MDW8452281.1 hypothetical protein [Oscillatoriaceae cyanobacterium SKYGB_i_bin93]HIK26616.1 hypothetical protein [Oscillatoriaceae cyanobacterium M7585_C2015_266]